MQSSMYSDPTQLDNQKQHFHFSIDRRVFDKTQSILWRVSPVNHQQPHKEYRLEMYVGGAQPTDLAITW
jgi:hypothetical protein